MMPSGWRSRPDSQRVETFGDRVKVGLGRPGEREDAGGIEQSSELVRARDGRVQQLLFSALYNPALMSAVRLTRRQGSPGSVSSVTSETCAIFVTVPV